MYKFRVFIIISVESSTPLSNCTDGQLRLVGGVNISEGRIEVCVNRAWGAVCKTGFGIHEATVACRQHGGYSTDGNVCLLLYM